MLLEYELFRYEVDRMGGFYFEFKLLKHEFSAWELERGIMTLHIFVEIRGGSLFDILTST